jgi:hypothetical protein
MKDMEKDLDRRGTACRAPTAYENTYFLVSHPLKLHYIFSRSVIPAKAGIHIYLPWIPACAGMTYAYFVSNKNNITLVVKALLLIRNFMRQRFQCCFARDNTAGGFLHDFIDKAIGLRI